MQTELAARIAYFDHMTGWLLPDGYLGNLCLSDVQALLPIA